MKCWSNNKIKIGHLNVRSILNNFAELSELITSESYDLFGVTETWLSGNISSDLMYIAGYTFYRYDRAGRGGGVGLFVRSCYSCEVLNFENNLNGENDGLEYLWLKINFGRIPLILGVVYRPPRSNLDRAVSGFDHVMSLLTPTYDNILIVGDLNVNFFNPNNKINLCLTAYNMEQIINEPTRITNYSETLIDPILVSIPEMCSDAGTRNADHISDHRLVFCELNFETKKPPPKLITYRDFNQFDEINFKTDLNLVPWYKILRIVAIDAKVEFLTANILDLFNKHISLLV